MRRGLIAWSRAELPEAVLDARVARLQAAMAAARLDAVIVYTIPARTAGVSWLTGFVPYWNEGLVVVPASGRPVLVSALSNRVKGWIERNAHVERVESNPRIGAEAATIIARAQSKAAVGVVDLALLPAGLIEALASGGHDVRDATDAFAGVKAVADPAEIALTARAATIAQAAFAAVADLDDPLDAGALVGRMDGEARRLGAEEVYPAVAVDLARRSNMIRIEGRQRLGAISGVRLTVAYKGCWARVTRTVINDRRADSAGPGEADAALEQCEERFAAAIAGLPQTAAFGPAKSWLIEGCRTTTPVSPLAGSMVADGEAPLPGEIVNVQATYVSDGRTCVLGAPVLIGAAGVPSSQLVLPPDGR